MQQDGFVENEVIMIQMQRKKQEIRQCDEIYGTIKNRWFDTGI